MATKQFAVPLDEHSTEPGDITFKALADAGTSAVFELTNVAAGLTPYELNLITKKNDVIKEHKFSATIANGKASVTLSASTLSAIYNDANGGDWDYVEAKWSVGSVNTPENSNQYEIQGGRTFNYNGWPPNS